MFKVGDKVRCIKGTNYMGTGNNLLNGKIYTFIKYSDTFPKEMYIKEDTSSSWYVDRFELVKEEKINSVDQRWDILNPIVSENKYKLIDSEMIATFDVDDTLIMWEEKVKDFEFQCPYDDKIKYQATKHNEHIQYLKEHKARGFFVIVWSAAGFQWAQAVVNALGLQNHVDMIMSKPAKFFDDLPAQEVLVNRVYIPYKEKLD